MPRAKNLDLLLSSMKHLIGVSPKIKLLIVGDGPDLAHYQQYCNKNKIENNVIFTGKVAWNEISSYYLISDVFATASHTETQGLTVIEAMASSLPVICINDESFTDTVIDNLNGKIFENRKEYKKCIVTLFKDKNLLKTLSKQARISAETHSSRYFAEQILEVYKIAIKNKPKLKIPIAEKIRKFIGGLKNGKNDNTKS